MKSRFFLSDIVPDLARIAHALLRASWTHSGATSWATRRAARDCRNPAAGCLLWRGFYMVFNSQPPSTAISDPTTQDASSEARNSATLDTSSVRPRALTGDRLIRATS